MKNFYDLSKADQIERWRQAYRVLRDMPEHARERHWDMSDFGRVNECGTIACAAGHCGLDTWFRRRGFKLVVTLEKDPAEREYGNYGDAELSGGVLEFFGSQGSDDIFYNANQRPVSVVMIEIARHITRLNEHGPEVDPNSYGSDDDIFPALYKFAAAKVTFE